MDFRWLGKEKGCQKGYSVRHSSVGDDFGHSRMFYLELCWRATSNDTTAILASSMSSAECP